MRASMLVVLTFDINAMIITQCKWGCLAEKWKQNLWCSLNHVSVFHIVYTGGIWFLIKLQCCYVSSHIHVFLAGLFICIFTSLITFSGMFIIVGNLPYLNELLDLEDWPRQMVILVQTIFSPLCCLDLVFLMVLKKMSKWTILWHKRDSK